MKRLLRAFLYSCLLAVISLLSVSMLWNEPALLAGILAIVSALMLLVWRSREDILTYFICGITGALAESFAIGFGAWTYAFPNIMRVPYWLPFLWGIAALFMKRISVEVHDFVRNRRSYSLAEIKSKI
ncbi:Uncharacterised protein [uncultured archaeon]|nr:Uncharacterised protein [uncultured archaeon]